MKLYHLVIRGLKRSDKIFIGINLSSVQVHILLGLFFWFNALLLYYIHWADAFVPGNLQ